MYFPIKASFLIQTNTDFAFPRIYIRENFNHFCRSKVQAPMVAACDERWSLAAKQPEMCNLASLPHMLGLK